MISLENMRSRLCLIKLKLRTAVNNRTLMRNIVIKYLRKRQDLRLVVYKCQHIDGTSILKLRIFVELIEYYLTVSVTSVLNYDTHTVSARFVAKLGYTLYSLFLYKIGNSLTQNTLVYLIRYLCNDYSVLILFDISFCSYHNASASRGVCLNNTVYAVNSRVCREVGALYVLHKVKHRTFGIIHSVNGRVNYLS